MAADVDFVWNYCNELSLKVLERERRFISGRAGRTLVKRRVLKSIR